MEEKEDEIYFPKCPLKRNEQIPITRCEKQRCIHLESEDGQLRCGFDLAKYRPRGRQI